MRIFLIGMPGSGKSYWTKQLALHLQYHSLDMDHFIEKQEKCTIPELFVRGEAYFRAKERKALKGIIKGNRDNIIVATGGGAPCYQDNMQLMKKSGCVLYLEASMESLLANIEKPAVPRPLLGNGSGTVLAEKLSGLYRERKEIYEQAHLKIDTDNATLTTFVQAIAQYLSDQNHPGNDV